MRRIQPCLLEWSILIYERVRYMLQKLPIGIQTFEKIRREDYLYVDKTKAIHRLLTSGAYFFLSRPRRSGKSLTLSTIKAIYTGRSLARSQFSRS